MSQHEQVAVLYSKDSRKMSTVSKLNDTWFIDFHLDEVLIDSMEITGCSIHYAESIAENYCLGILKVCDAFKVDTDKIKKKVKHD